MLNDVSAQVKERPRASNISAHDKRAGLLNNLTTFRKMIAFSSELERNYLMLRHSMHNADSRVAREAKQPTKMVSAKHSSRTITAAQSKHIKNFDAKRAKFEAMLRRDVTASIETLGVLLTSDKIL